MKSKHRTLLVVFFIIVALFAVNWLNSGSNMRPDLTFTDIDGQSHSLEQYNGKPILVTFWATDCTGCIQEMPELIALHKQYSDQGLVMIDIAMSHDSPKHIKAMRDERKLPFIITWDKDNEMALAFDNVRVTPTHFLIEPNGEISMRKIGSLNHIILEDKLHKMGLSAI